LILTDVPRAYVDYGTPEQTALERVTASQMRAYAAAGHFKAGSMGPKVEACLRFVDAGGESVIASLTEVGPAMAGRAGTHIVPDGEGRRASEPAGGEDAASGKPGAKPQAKAAGAKKGAARKQPAKRPRRSTEAAAGADVIDIATARRRTAAR
ncbi:MAG TPA: hypothetical protein VFZ86_11170, partial [Thermoleophilia bacterium]|nr:hypothetical protein [Thermoleophilia bacterium]